jgi:hypothetical protein
LSGKLIGSFVGVPKLVQAATPWDASHNTSTMLNNSETPQRLKLVKFGCVQP